MMRTAADAIRSAQPLTEDDLRAAAMAPMPRPAVTAAPGVGQVRREDPQRALALLKSRRPLQAAPPAAAPQQWTGAQKAMLHQAEYGDDPFAREAARQALVDQGLLPGTPAPRQVAKTAKTVRGLAWAAGPDGTFGWRPMPETGPLDLGIIPPGTTGR